MVKAKNTRIIVDAVVVEFDNGYNITFEPYTHGFGYQIEGLSRTVLTNENHEALCEINSRLYRVGPMEDEHKIARISKEITQIEVAEYWQKAKDYISEKFDLHGEVRDDKYWYHWRVSTEGYFDLERLKENKMEMLKNKEQ